MRLRLKARAQGEPHYLRSTHPAHASFRDVKDAYVDKLSSASVAES